MEKKVKGLIALSCLSVLAMGAIVGVAAGKEAGFVRNELPNIRSAKKLVDFSTADITRRVYFVDNKDGWWDGKTLEIKAFGGSLAGEQWVDATRMYDTYYQGLYYADITGVGAGSAIKVQAHVKGYGDEQWWSVEQTLPSLGSKEEDVLWLNDGTTTGDEHGYRYSSIGSAGGTAAQVASFLDFISTCTTSYASGYNAYPQLMANFITPSAGAIAADGDSTYVEGKTAYTLNQKIAKLQALYDADGWYIA